MPAEDRGVRGNHIMPAAATIGDTPGRVGPANRPFTTHGPETVTVPGDYSTVQAALNDTPYLLQHTREIRVDPGYYAEDLYVPRVVPVDMDDTADTNEGRDAVINLRPNVTNPDIDSGDAIEFDSLYIQGPAGQLGAIVQQTKVRNASPYPNESAGIFVNGPGSVQLYDIAFGDVKGNSGESDVDGILSYEGKVKLQGKVRAGSSNLDRLLHTKSLGMVNGRSTDLSGSVDDVICFAPTGIIWFRMEDALTGANGVADADQGIVKVGGQAVYGIRDLLGQDKYNLGSNTTSDPSAPDTGVSFYYRSDTSPPELRAIDQNGTVSTITTF